VTGLYVAVAMAVLAGSLVLLCHPLLRFLKIGEVPSALLIACSGRLSRRRLLYVLRSRRQVYLEDIAGLPPEYLWVVLAWRSVVTRLTALAHRLRRRAAFAWQNGPLVAPSGSFEAVADVIEVAARNPWAGEVQAELDVHRAEVAGYDPFTNQAYAPGEADLTAEELARTVAFLMRSTW
jgi:hypothetical protein